jgi:hypothetical protein
MVYDRLLQTPQEHGIVDPPPDANRSTRLPAYPGHDDRKPDGILIGPERGVKRPPLDFGRKSGGIQVKGAGRRAEGLFVLEAFAYDVFSYRQ